MKPVLLLAIAALVFAGCGRRETRVEVGNREQVLHINNGAEPQDLDPHVVTGVPEHHVIMKLLEDLVSEDPRGITPQPGAAEHFGAEVLVGFGIVRGPELPAVHLELPDTDAGNAEQFARFKRRLVKLDRTMPAPNG